MKFEDFIDNLVKFTDDNLPNDNLKEFHRSYIWAMMDPMVFF